MTRLVHDNTGEDMSNKKGGRLRVVYICMAIILLAVAGCVEEKGQIKSQTSKNGQELLTIPEEFTIYQDYVQVIGGKPQRIRDKGVIEATVISLTRTEVCPYQEETCIIEPYPKDIGIVRIDKIINYTPYSEQTAEPVEQPSRDSLPENGNKGTEYPSKPKPEYAPLKEGQEVQALFLLTVRQTKIRYIPVNESEGSRESLQLPEENKTVGQKASPGSKTFKPIPKDGNYFVFTTKIGKFSGIIEKILPGLEVGSKFRAEIYYDGSLYIEEYEIIK
jgi:hypothetical protein